MIQYIEDESQKESICHSILQSLPDWFGIPESTAEYVRNVRDLPFWAEVTDEKAMGFIAIKETSRYAAEIYVMGVRPELHGSGIGHKLFDALYSYALEHDYLFLQVKTVKEGCYEEYDMTNRYYRKMGFRELECFPTLWDENNPCQIYLLAVQKATGTN